MPFALILVALVLIVAGGRDNARALGALIAKDFSGTGNFFYWLAAIGAVGSIGYIPRAEKVSRAFLVLIMVVMVLSSRGFFQQFTNALAAIKAPAPASDASLGSSGGTTATAAPATAASSTAIPSAAGSSLFGGLTPFGVNPFALSEGAAKLLQGVIQ